MSDEPKFVNESLDKMDYDSLAVDAKRKILQDTYRALKASVKKKAAEMAVQRAANMMENIRKDIEETDVYLPEVPKRDIKQMHDFGYQIINRELSRFNQISSACGLTDDQIQSLTRLMGTLNVTEKTKKSINEETDETKQKEGESDSDYRTRLESAIKR